MSNKSLYCEVCHSQKLHTKEGTNHLFHIIISLMTGGIWIPIWIIAGVLNMTKRYRCTGCGNPRLF